MKISDNTITILKNFSSINPSIHIRKGNKLRTIAMSGNIAAVAKIEDEFETEFGIYDVNQFLNGLKLYENPELDFSKEKRVLIRHGNHKITYRLTDPSLIFSAEDRDIKLPSKDVCFILSEKSFEKLMKASSVFSLPDFSVVGDGKQIELQVCDKENPSSNEVSIVVGETDEEFKLNYKMEYLKIIPGDYEVIISKQLISQFTNKNFDLTYFIGLESDSVFYS